LFQKGTSSSAEIYKALAKAPKFKVALEVAELTQPCGNAGEVLPISKVISATNTEAVIVVAPKILQNKNIK
jgi:ribosomal protein L18E